MQINPTQRYSRADKKYEKKHYPMDYVDKCVEAILTNDTAFN